MTPRRKGSGLVLVLITISALALVLGSVLNFGVTERSLNARHLARMEARHAAETAVEFGLADIMRRVRIVSAFSRDALHPESGDPLILPDDFYRMYDGTSDDVFTQVILPPTGPTIRSAPGAATTPKSSVASCPTSAGRFSIPASFPTIR
ncbi:MAG: hypothetical protein HC841_04295 [Verrucomicrobiae bacterium]|nr:hypothetical protein [Verrucomicrobiae bacterium]